MTPDFVILLGAAATIGVTHTAVGLDHTLPFILLGRARAWSLPKTLGITAVCGFGHVMSSVVVGLLGVTLAVGVSSLQWFEDVRGEWVAWALVAFGSLYALLSLSRLGRTSHRHLHVHADGTVHRHHHGHGEGLPAPEQHHPADAPEPSPLKQGNLFASLFVVFLLGPCEALLPLMTAPGLQSEPLASLGIALVFGGATLGTMLALVSVGWFGMRAPWLGRVEPHLNWISGAAIAGSGLGMHWLGL